MGYMTTVIGRDKFRYVLFVIFSVVETGQGYADYQTISS